jgi:glycine C-acetyltransferase
MAVRLRNASRDLLSTACGAKEEETHGRASLQAGLCARRSMTCGYEITFGLSQTTFGLSQTTYDGSQSLAFQAVIAVGLEGRTFITAGVSPADNTRVEGQSVPPPLPYFFFPGYLLLLYYLKTHKNMNAYTSFQKYLEDEILSIRSAGLYKEERTIASPQSVHIRLQNGKSVLNFCANNYLGLSDHPGLIGAAVETMERRGYGMSSVRFICGTQDVHKELEQTISDFFGTEDTLLYASCFDANGGVFEPLLTEEDAIISDTLNHASIIDGVRLCKAIRYRYANANMEDLETQLQTAQAQRFRLIVTDGVFSMDGNVAPLDQIHALAVKYQAMVMVDESHSAGVVGATGRGTTEAFDLRGKIEILTGTLGKAFGGAIGGFTTGKKEIIELLRQRSRPYLFSNSLPPAVAGAGIYAFRMLQQSNELQDKLHANARYFAEKIKAAGFDIKPTQSAICAVMLYDAVLSQEMAARLSEEGIFVTGFSYPVVPKGQARIRVQLSAKHEKADLDRCIEAFITIGKQLAVLA